MLLIYEEKSSATASGTAHTRNFLILFIIILILEKIVDSLECVSASIGTGSTGETFSMTRTTGGCDVACSTFGRRVIRLRVLVREPF